MAAKTVARKGGVCFYKNSLLGLNPMNALLPH